MGRRASVQSTVFRFDVAGVEANVQLARYDAADSGFYDWHYDFGPAKPLRKLSISIQLSASADYDGAGHARHALEPRRVDPGEALALRPAVTLD